MQTLAETLPEYAVLRSMAGVGDRLGPLILAEIGDIRRFHSGKALNAYAGNDAPPYQSGTFESHNRHISKRGNTHSLNCMPTDNITNHQTLLSG